jgi:hypothetical protein
MLIVTRGANLNDDLERHTCNTHLMKSKSDSYSEYRELKLNIRITDSSNEEQ